MWNVLEPKRKPKLSFENVGSAQLLCHVWERSLRCLIPEDSVGCRVLLWAGREYRDSSYRTGSLGGSWATLCHVHGEQRSRCHEEEPLSWQEDKYVYLIVWGVRWTAWGEGTVLSLKTDNGALLLQTGYKSWIQSSGGAHQVVLNTSKP